MEMENNMGIYYGPRWKQRNPRAINAWKPPIVLPKVFNPRLQTTFGYGKHHFSPTHKIHKFGSISPVQRDFGLHMPNGHFKPLVGVSSPKKLSVQTKLQQFRRYKKKW